MRKELQRLHALGFGILLLKERQKAPVESGWTKGPRKTLDELKSGYQHGMNIGVRLGKASQIGFEYLAAIDCDVKSREKKHLDQLEEKLFELFGESVAGAPTVASGRGNGSKHIYIVTAEPVASRRLAQSNEKVKVHMPSVKASKADQERLSTLEIEQGMRMRAAWEISLMGEGAQCVLPPSIHPDSGKHYIWSRPCLAAEDLPSVEISGGVAAPVLEEVKDFTAVSVMIDFEGLSDRVLKLIRTGEGSTGGNESLMVCALAMCGAGMDDDQILSVLSDPDYWISGVAGEHTKSRSRARQVEWLRKYTLKKARHMTSAAADFEDMVEIAPLSAEAAEEQKEELIGEKSVSWRSHIERGGRNGDGPPKMTLKNTLLMLRNAVDPSMFRRDEFANAEVYGASPPWSGDCGEELRDIDISNIREWLSEHFSFEPNTNLVEEAIKIVAHKNRFHPVKQYLEALPPWDATPRVDTWIKRLLNGVGPEPYLSAISRKFLVAMIARIYHPGVKLDTVLTLVGDQGVRKSTSLATLAAPWGSDAKMDINDKDGVLAMRGAWLMELGELSSLNKAEVEHVKEFISRSTDRIRLPYGRRTEKFPRQCVFAGTTNNTEFLKDETGNRRFWPVKVGECDIEGLAAERDQLFAEAMILYELGEKPWLSKEEDAGALEVQMKHLESDVLEEKIEELMGDGRIEGFNSERFLMNEFYKTFGDALSLKDDQMTQKRVGRALRKLGYEKRPTRLKTGKIVKMWILKNVARPHG